MRDLRRGEGVTVEERVSPGAPLGQPVVVLRPLIETWREDVEAYCREKRLQPRLDVTNLSRAFLRNRVRLDLLPYLERQFGAEIRANLHRLSQLARPEGQMLERMALDTLAETAAAVDGGLEFAVGTLAALDLAIRRRVVRAALRQVKGDPVEIGFREIDRVLEALARGDSQFDLPGPVRVRKRKERLRIIRPQTPAIPEFEESGLSVPGQAPTPDGGAIEGEMLECPDGFEPPRTPYARQVFLDADGVVLPLSVRSWRPGDRFTPLGMAGRKSLRRLFMDAKAPASERARVPVITDRQGILWVAGLAIADRAKVTSKTRRLLSLHWRPAAGPEDLQVTR